MSIKKIRTGLLVLACCFSLSQCSKGLAPGDYDTAEVGKVRKVVPGTLLTIRPVRLHSTSGMHASDLDKGSDSMEHSHGYEYVIRLNSGSIISVVQAGNLKLKPKQHVLVISGKNTRVVPDNGSEDY